MKKKLLSVLLTAAMTVSLAACGGSDEGAVTNNADDANAVESTESADAEAVASERPDTPMGQLVIGTTTDLEQDFYDPTYNNSATCYKVQLGMLHGYSTVSTTKDGEWIADPTVVADLQSVENEDGTKTHTVKLNEGLLGLMARR